MVKTTRRTASSMIAETNKDLVKALDVIDTLNKRIYDIELKTEDHVKLFNVTTNTINYVLASLYVYESYLAELGIQQSVLRNEIDTVFYTAFVKKTDSVQFSNNIIKKVNDQLLKFQEKVNQYK